MNKLIKYVKYIVILKDLDVEGLVELLEHEFIKDYNII